MIRRNKRLRREYLYRKTIESAKQSVLDKKKTLQQAINENSEIPTHLRKGAIKLVDAAEYDDEGNELSTNPEDDEYRWAGVDNPKIVITTSYDPSSKLKIFSKEMKLILPNSQRINRGHYDLKSLLETCRNNNVTDLIMLTENRGRPDGMIVCHLPFGPTAYFQLLNVVLRHDIPNIDKMSEAYPHLVFHNFKSKLGNRTMNILKYLFPVPKSDSKRVITFANYCDHISFRHHNYSKVDNKYELAECGPRFELKLYQIKLGTIEHESIAQTEWVMKPFMNTWKKRLFLSDELF